MESNLLLEQYGKFKKAELEESPFRCLLDTNIEINPHQINAFCAAIQALKTGGIVLADEVGLGKTIEAGLTLKYVLDSGAKRVLIALPATLRKQWEIELEEKFGLESTILDRFTVESEPTGWKTWLEDKSKVRIVLASYDYSSKLMKRFPNVKWDFIIIDEAHNLRNVFHGTKRAKRLYDLSQGIPKILLTATPLQNTLSDLHGLISFIDPRIFGSEKVFNKRFIEGEDYAELKRELIPVLYRTLRRDVGKYMDFKKRECRTIDFVLSPDEVELYMRVNNFLKRDALYSMSLRKPQQEALSYLDAISTHCDYKKDSKAAIEAVATEYCEKQRKIKVDDKFDFPSFCYAMATGIGKTRLMGASIYYLYKTKGYRHFFILAPGNTIYEKLRKESNPNHPKYIFKGLESEIEKTKYHIENSTDTHIMDIERGIGRADVMRSRF